MSPTQNFSEIRQNEAPNESMRSQVRRTAELAKLSLTPAEEAQMATELEAILTFAAELKHADTRDVPMTAHVVPLENVLRPDETVPPFDRELLLQNAPARTEDSIVVPQTLA